MPARSPSVTSLTRAAVNVLAGLCFALSATTADAEPGEPSLPPALEDGAIWVTQQRLSRVVDSLAAASDADAGFSAVEVDVAAGTVVVHRVGGAGDAAAAAYQRAADSTLTVENEAQRSARPTGLLDSGPDDLRLEVRPAVLARAQTLQLERRLVAESEARRGEGIAIEHFGPGAAGGPFRIGVVAADRHRAAVEQAYGIFGAGTVEVVEAQPRPTVANRMRDSSPFYGGARIRKGGGMAHGSCTGGFTGRSGINGADYLMTAAHCVNYDARYFTTPLSNAGGSHLQIGDVTAINYGLDVAFIRTSTAPYVFDGGVTDAFTKQVVGVRGYVRGEYTCVSGSYTGVRCEAVLDATEYIRNCMGNGVCVQVPVIKAIHARGAALVQPGDSGAPVFTPRADQRTVTARGMVTNAGLEVVACPDGSRRCAPVMFFVDITRITTAHRLDLTR